MNGREPKELNDIFYTCSLIEYIARKTKNKPQNIAKKLGERNIRKIFELADVYHSENIDAVCDQFVQNCKIKKGNFDNVGACEYNIPSHWDIGKVYKRLVNMIFMFENLDYIEAIIKAYQSNVSNLIEDYNSSFYYENPSYIFACYQNGGKAL